LLDLKGLKQLFSIKNTSKTPKMISRSLSPEFSPLAIDEDFTPLPIYKAASTTSINFSNLLEPPLELHEDLKSGCGGQLWPAGMVLAQQMLRYHRSSLKFGRM
jgi:protein N-lysine methyltransferase METTL21A